jgi:hypothetical protein
MAFLQDDGTELPFTVGGATQAGLHPGMEGNNQDAVGLLLDRDLIAGVVCDGCASPSEYSQNSRSSNEVGAKLSCVVLARLCWMLAHKGGLVDPERFLERLGRAYGERILQFSGLGGRRPCMKNYLLFEFFTATVIGFVVTREHFLVYGVGDGLTLINGALDERKSKEGEYPATRLLAPRGSVRPGPLRLDAIASGSTGTIENLLIGTDGMYDFFRMTPEVAGLLAPSAEGGPRGYDPLVTRDLRRRIHQLPGEDSRILLDMPHDDRSLISLRRLRGQRMETP